MGEVADFEKRLFKQAGRHFAEWRLIDLHNHSPASFDYSGEVSSAAEDTAQAIRDHDLSAVMFTDHACLPDRAFVENVRTNTQSLILRGTELNVLVDALNKDKVGSNIYFHLLIGFNPSGPRSEDFWLEKIYQDCGEQQIDCGGKPLKAIQRNMDFLVDALNDAGAIVIPAHLHSGKDAYKSRSIDDIFADKSFLKFAERHFTALEVLNPNTAAYFDGSHAETGNLHRSCVVSSDSHKASDLGRKVTYAQMEKLTFEELKAALELPFRVSIAKPEIPEAYIIGAHVEGAFLKDTWITFSPHCNVLIGVKGSGKTSILECVRFALGVEVPSSRADDVRKHLEAILGPGGRVQVLVKRGDGAKILIERSLANPSFQVTFSDDNKHTFRNREGIQFPAHVLGWHEIEHVAVDPQIRRLYLDKIAGEAELNRLDEELHTLTSQVRQKHESSVAKFQQLKSLDERIERLEELRLGLQKLTDENLIGLKEIYERGVSDHSSITALADKLEKSSPTLKQRVYELISGIDTILFSGAEQLKEAAILAEEALKELKLETDSAALSLETVAHRVTEKVNEARQKASDAFQKLAEEYRGAVAKLSPEHQKLLESHLRISDETRQLQSLRGQFNEIRGQLDVLFGELGELCDAIISKMDARTNLRNSKVEELSLRLYASGVKLTVVPYAAKWRFESVAQSARQSWEYYQEIQRQFPGAPRFHDLLRHAYKDLRQNLIASRYAYVLRSADLGPILDAYEDDDLVVEFDPNLETSGSQRNPQYKPIDHLSAGQRCTAVFPILLGLEKAPLLIDQPEDNLDNRHIAHKIAGSVLQNKKTRQMLFTSHNANLVVMSDPEKIITFEASEGSGRIEEGGFLSHPESKIMRQVLDILDGGERALELRARKYGKWRHA